LSATRTSPAQTGRHNSVTGNTWPPGTG
jgi:hypothetical protein